MWAATAVFEFPSRLIPALPSGDVMNVRTMLLKRYLLVHEGIDTEKECNLKAKLNGIDHKIRLDIKIDR